jgi:hypothetical protein
MVHVRISNELTVMSILFASNGVVTGYLAIFILEFFDEALILIFPFSSGTSVHTIILGTCLVTCDRDEAAVLAAVGCGNLFPPQKVYFTLFVLIAVVFVHGINSQERQ